MKMGDNHTASYVFTGHVHSKFNLSCRLGWMLA